MVKANYRCVDGSKNQTQHDLEGVDARRRARCEGALTAQLAYQIASVLSRGSTAARSTSVLHSVWRTLPPRHGSAYLTQLSVTYLITVAWRGAGIPPVDGEPRWHSHSTPAVSHTGRIVDAFHDNVCSCSRVSRHTSYINSVCGLHP